MSEISDMQKQIKKQQQLLIKTKLRQTIKDIEEEKEQSKTNSLHGDSEIYLLLDMLKKAGLTEGKDFYFEEEPFDYNETVPNLSIRIGNHVFTFNGMSSITEIMTIQELEEYAREEESEELGSNPYAKLLKLVPVELERIGIDMESADIQQAEPEENSAQQNETEYEHTNEGTPSRLSEYRETKAQIEENNKEARDEIEKLTELLGLEGYGDDGQK